MVRVPDPEPGPQIVSTTLRVLLGLVAGLVAGIALAVAGGAATPRVVAVVEPIGALWVNAIRMTVVPLVVALLVAGIAGAPSRAAGGIGGRALALFGLLAGGSGLLAALATPPLIAALPLDATAVTALGADAAGAASVALPPFRDWLTGLVPPNPIDAAARTEMLPLIVFTVIFALALGRLDAARRDPAVGLFRTVADAMFVVVEWILAVAPVGVFCLVVPLAAAMGLELVGAIGYFLLVVCGLILLATAALYPVAALAGRVPLSRFARAAAPAQAVAFSTRSSLASLPALIEGADRTLRLPTRVSGIVLPTAVSLFKFASPIARIGGTVFIARLYGIELGGAEVAAIAAALTLLSFYSPGIPSGGLLILAPVYLSFGLPVEGVGILIALDMVPDMFITLSNVTANLTVATVVARTDAGTLEPEPAPAPVARAAAPAVARGRGDGG